MRKNWKLIGLVLVLPFILSACTWPWQKKKTADLVFPDISLPQEESETATPAGETEAVEPDLKIHKFESREELSAWLAANSVSLSSGGLKNLDAMPALGRQTLTASAETGTAADYSGTNNQETDVDEADIIKTDGKYIYALVRNELVIIQATPATSADVVSRIVFQSRPRDLFIKDNFLAVFGDDEQVYNLPIYSPFRRTNPYSFFKAFDISNPAAPKLLRDLKFEGSYRDARLVDNYVYFISETYGSYIANEPLVPRVIEQGRVLSETCSGTAGCFAPSVYYFDLPYDSYNFTSITAINLTDATEAISGDVYLLDNQQALYVSKNNIYITYTKYLNEYELEQEVKRRVVFPLLSAEDQARIKDIESAPAHVLAEREKKEKAGQIIDRYLSSLAAAEQESLGQAIDSGLAALIQERSADMEKTIIHKIAIKGRELNYQAMGEAPGQLLNQFPMDEEGGYFRLATTRSEQWSRLTSSPTASYNNLYVMDQDMKIVGRLENLATSERIYAVRFIGERAYIVTFKQTDPLFAISLSDPTKPSVLGALKVPGFSNYLHPADEKGERLIGFGRDTEETSGGGVITKGLKLSLYDFKDVARPKELSTVVIGDASSDSIALNDHRAFLYSEVKDVLSLPVSLREKGELTFSGSLVFSVKNNSLDLRGRIDHSSGGRLAPADMWNGYDYYDNTVKRSLYIGDYLYTFSNNFLKINSLADLKEVSGLKLTTVKDDYTITPPATQPEEAAVEPGAATPETPPETAPETGVEAPPAI